MADSKPVEIYCSIPIYLKRIDRRTVWLQWQWHEIRYGVPITTPEEAIWKARTIIDAMLALEAQESGIPPSTFSARGVDRHPALDEAMVILSA